MYTFHEWEDVCDLCERNVEPADVVTDLRKQQSETAEWSAPEVKACTSEWSACTNMLKYYHDRKKWSKTRQLNLNLHLSNDLQYFFSIHGRPSINRDILQQNELHKKTCIERR